MKLVLRRKHYSVWHEHTFLRWRFVWRYSHYGKEPQHSFFVWPMISTWIVLSAVRNKVRMRYWFERVSRVGDVPSMPFVALYFSIVWNYSSMQVVERRLFLLQWWSWCNDRTIQHRNSKWSIKKEIIHHYFFSSVLHGYWIFKKVVGTELQMMCWLTVKRNKAKLASDHERSIGRRAGQHNTTPP